MADKVKREFKGVWIKKDIWLNGDLTLTEKCFYAEIDSLDGENGCFANNAHFAKFSNLSKNRCGEIINGLKKKGLIKIKYIYEDDKKKIKKRVINIIKESHIISNTPHRESEYPPSKNTEDRYPYKKNTNNTYVQEKDLERFAKKDIKNEKYYPLSEKLKTNIQKISPNAIIRDTQLKTWSNDFRLMVEQDNRTYEFINNLLDKVFKDEFWSKHIRSAGKLRIRLNEGKLDNVGPKPKFEQTNIFNQQSYMPEYMQKAMKQK